MSFFSNPPSVASAAGSDEFVVSAGKDFRDGHEEGRKGVSQPIYINK